MKWFALTCLIVLAACVGTPVTMITSGHCPEGLIEVPHQGITICVTPDYYMEDGIRMPVGLDRAFAIADQRGMILPTPAMVDSIYSAADIRLSPRPLNPTNTGDPNFWNGPIADPRWFPVHNAIIEAQLEGRNVEGLLIAGHKKDIVAIDRNTSRVAIYGWHRGVGDVIQNYNAVSHGRNYRDYSHGLRLVYPIGFGPNGETYDLR